MKRFYGRMRRALTCLLALAMLLGASVLLVSADVERDYLAELRISVAPTFEEAAALLKQAGYTILEQDLNEGTGDGTLSVCLGYKTTTDPTEALTNISMLSMNGVYGYTDPQTIERLCGETLDRAAEAVQTAGAALEEACANGVRPALWAKGVMDGFYDKTSGKSLGALLCSEADTATVRRLLTEGNLTVWSVLMTMLYIGTGRTDGRALVKTLTEQDATAVVTDGEMLATARALLEDLDTVREPLTTYRNAAVKWDAESADVTAYMERLNDRELGAYLMGGAYDKMAGETLAELLTRESLTAEELLPVAAAMTDAQRALAPYLSADVLLFGSYLVGLTDEPSSGETEAETGESGDGEVSDAPTAEQTEAQATETATETAEDTASESKRETPRETQDPLQVGLCDLLYNGSFALTETAMQYSGQNINLDWLWEGEIFTEHFDWQLVFIYQNLLTQAAQDGYGVVYPERAERNDHNTARFLQLYHQARAKSVAPVRCARALTGLSVPSVEAVSRLSAGAIASLYGLYEGTLRYQDVLTEYKVIPEKVVQLREKDLCYAVYDAVRQDVAAGSTVTAANGETVELDGKVGDFGDVNGWCGDQWSAIYVTKDPKEGKPIYAKDFCAIADQEKSALERNVVRAFCSRLSYNLNWYAPEDGLGGLYLYFDRVQDYGERTTTVFSRLDLCLAIGGASVGGIIIGAVAVYVGYETTRKKREDRAQAVLQDVSLQKEDQSKEEG